MSLTDQLQSATIRALTRQMFAHNERLGALEEIMATLIETLQVIDTETNEIGALVNQAVDELTALRGQLAQIDQATADQLAPIVDRLAATGDRLRSVAADPDNPVPAPEEGTTEPGV